MKALLIIDIQKGLTKRKLFQKDLFLKTVNRAINHYRKNEDLIIFVQHENKQLIKDTDDWQLDESLATKAEDTYLTKKKGDAFTNSELSITLDNNGAYDVLICGLVSHGCVAFTLRGGHNLGYNISLLKNGHTNWNKDALVKIEDTEKLLKELNAELVKY